MGTGNGSLLNIQYFCIIYLTKSYENTLKLALNKYNIKFIALKSLQFFSMTDLGFPLNFSFHISDRVASLT